MSTYSEKKRAASIRRMLGWREQVFSRQPSYGHWGPAYVSAMFATPDEAPTASRPTAFFSRRQQRYVHPMGYPEAVFGAFADYHPSVWEYHEGHLLQPWPVDHPLACHPLYADRPWPSTRGTIQILAGMGRLREHPRVPAFSIDGTLLTDGNAVLAWIGDMMLFLQDAAREPYVLDWDIKNSIGRHGQPWAGNWRAAHSPRAKRRAALRDAGYEAYMAELQIGIRRVALEEIDVEVSRNLVRLCSRYQSEVGLPDALIQDLDAAYAECLRCGDPPLVVIKRLVADPSLFGEAGRVLDHAVWERRLRVDLWRPILVDQPLLPERIDLLEHHRAWFAKDLP